MLNLDNKIVNVGFSDPVGPPKLWFLNLNVDINILFFDRAGGFSQDFILKLDNHMVTLFNNFRNIQSHSKIDNSLFLADEPVPRPDVVYL